MPDGRPCNDALVSKIQAAIDYAVIEWDMTYSEIIGCLESVKYDVLEEMKSDIDDEDDEDG